MNTPKVIALRKQIEELKQQWPAHSASPALLQKLEDLEEELEIELAKTDGEGDLDA